MRRKTILIILATIILFLLTISFITRIRMLGEFRNLQNQKVEEKINGVLDLLEKRFDTLSVMVNDWSSWDETYYFVDDLNQEYIDNNLAASTMDNLGINFMLFMNNEGAIVHEEFYDDIRGIKTDTPPELKEYFNPGSAILQYDGNTDNNYGIIMIPGNPVILCSQPILRNDGSGPAAGSMAWGYYLNEDTLEEISGTLNTDIRMLRIDDDSNPVTKEIIAEIPEGSNSLIRHLNNKEINGYLLVDDYFGRPSILFELEMTPDIYNYGVKSFYFILMFITLAGFVIGLTIVIYLDRSVLSRLQNLSDATNLIGKSLDPSKRVDAHGDDEISRLADEINIMLDLKSKHESVLAHYASHDILTGVANRRLFDMELKRAIAKASRGGRSFLIFMDIDNFKVINDSYGHAFGDKVLIAISHLARENIRKEDMIARFGGDEFLVLIEHDDLEKAKATAERLRKIINGFNINSKNKKIGFTVSMGLTQVDQDDSPDLVLSKADKAMYRAKEMGKNRLAIFEPDKDIYGGKFEILLKLREAIEKDLFELYIQPIIEIENGGVVYHEAVLRLPDNKYGLIHQNAFIPLAENNGLIGSITDLSLKKVIKILEEDSKKCIFINLPVKCLADKSYLEKIKDLILKSKISPSQLGFEITESSMFDDVVLARECIKTLKDIGCRFAIDDFGTGFSSYGILSELPLDFFKIAGGMIKGMDSDSSKAAIVKSIKLLADLLGKKTVTSWMESPGTAGTIRATGTGYDQDFSYGQPGSAD
ncbi:MAG: EAL domain-containing protein [Actinobacteria bacterium]|nr:EAL domain-containing protein [Actinomycetota bacterium]